MKKKAIIILIFIPIFSLCQVGINTINPQQLFHTDGRISTLTTNHISETPNEIQQSDDVVITNQGHIGVGTINPKGAIEINSINRGFIPPRLFNNQRDSIPVGYRPTGTMIFNLNSSKIQVNVGTDNIPIWVNLDTSSNTINTTKVYSKISPQIIEYISDETPIIFENLIFNNTPNGFINKKIDNMTINLASGKTYKIEINMGRIESSDNNHTWCFIKDLTNLNLPLSQVSILANSGNENWNSFNTMQAYLKVPDNQDNGKDIQIRCKKQNSGRVKINEGIAPILSITILD